MRVKSVSAGDMAKTELFYQSVGRWEIITTISDKKIERIVYGDERKARGEFEKEVKRMNAQVAQELKRRSVWD